MRSATSKEGTSCAFSRRRRCAGRRSDGDAQYDQDVHALMASASFAGCGHYSARIPASLITFPILAMSSLIAAASSRFTTISGIATDGKCATRPQLWLVLPPIILCVHRVPRGKAFSSSTESAGSAQLLDFMCSHAEPVLENIGRMLAEFRRGAAVLDGRGAQPDGTADAGYLRSVAPLDLDLEPTRTRLLHLEHLLEIVDAPVRHAPGIEFCHQFVDFARRERLAQLLEREIAIDLPRRGRGEPRIRREVGARQRRAQRLPLGIVAAGDDQVAVGALEGLVRHHDAGGGRAGADRYPARLEIGRRLVHGE